MKIFILELSQVLVDSKVEQKRYLSSIVIIESISEET
jgi:hypothetical protein